jgi:MoaA/NifB/PqqE/SkfB family radical SAM enzyme
LRMAAKGKCGRRRCLRACGGCRARANELKGDPFEAEPHCAYGGHAT